MLKEEFLALQTNFNQDKNDKYEEKVPTFESNTRLINWSLPQYNEYRGWSMKSQRDFFFGLLNQSRCQQRVCDLEEQAHKLWAKCEQLTEECKKLDAKMMVHKNENMENLDELKTQIKIQNNKNDEMFAKHNKKIKNNEADLGEHQKELLKINDVTASFSREISNIQTKIEKNRERAADQLTKLKNEQDERMNDLEKTEGDNLENTLNKISEMNVKFKDNIGSLEDKILQKVDIEIQKLSNEVKEATEKVQQDNSGIYDRYDEKLKTIKDVCAQYFSKYETILINHQTVVKDLEKQQEQWVEMLIKP